MKKVQDDDSNFNAWNISIAPNPASNNLNLTWEQSKSFNKELTIKLMDLQGKILLTRNVAGDVGNINLDVSNISAGVYILNGTDKVGIQFTEKVIIKK